MPAISPADTAFQRGLAALRAGHVKDAETLFRTTLNAQPQHLGALNLLGVVLTQIGSLAEAETYLRRALAEQPKSDATLYNYAIVLKGLGRPAEALDRFTEALAVNPGVAETWNNRGTVFNDLKRYDEAIADFDRAIALNPRYADALCNQGKSFAALKRFDDALAAFQNALALKPDLAEAWCGSGDVHFAGKRYGDALAAADKALALRPGLAEAWLGRGNVLANLKHYDDALAAYDRALALKPALAEAWLGRGNIFFDLKRCDDTLAAYERASALKPSLAEAWLGRGNVFAELRRYAEAFAVYDKASALEPELNYVTASRLHAKLHLCDWSGLDGDIAQLAAQVRDGKVASDPLAVVAVLPSPADHLRCARRYVEDYPAAPSLWRGEIYTHDRIRVAYLSADFHEHATAYLAAGLFEQHDRSHFEITALSVGPDDGSPMRRRLEAAFERFLDVRTKTDREIAELIRQLEIDIVVDLKGFTANSRLGVMAHRAAPVQVNYLGYPGTMGASFIDYILGDATVVPADHFDLYSEKVVWLPNSYQVNDSQRLIAAQGPTRQQCGLPETGFVFCCFNNTYKIMPEVFGIWMRLLKAIDGSVLWLLEASAEATTNLRREARAHGVAPERLIFAGRTALAEHLARHRCADLGLDTLPYNAHTTGSDALWAGLPFVTCLGSAFPGRVGASLLAAAGLAELVTTSLPDYEALTLRLARDPALLGDVKAKLRHSHTTCPLFDTDRFRRDIEQAYSTMIDIHRSGKSPRSFAVGTA